MRNFWDNDSLIWIEAIFPFENQLSNNDDESYLKEEKQEIELYSNLE